MTRDPALVRLVRELATAPESRIEFLCDPVRFAGRFGLELTSEQIAHLKDNLETCSLEDLDERLSKSICLF